MFSKNIFSQSKRFSKFLNTNSYGSLNFTKKYSFNSFSKFGYSDITTERSYGGLKDQDRIFTNLYNDDDPYIEGAIRRVIVYLAYSSFNIII